MRYQPGFWGLTCTASVENYEWYRATVERGYPHCVYTVETPDMT